MKNILGIDLGTSSVKMIYNDGDQVYKISEKYDSVSLDGWMSAIKKCASKLDLSKLRAVGLSSQVGTYIIDGDNIISWNEPYGKDELDEILSNVSRDEFIREIGMPHPKIISYPLPRLLYIKKNCKQARKVCQPKDRICLELCGRYVSDKFSWRGLAALNGSGYSANLLKKYELEDFELPLLADPTEKIGEVTFEGSQKSGIPEGAEIYVGCNDFFAGLIGMGIWKDGDAFDITGTSEHLGLLSESIPHEDDGLVAGPYFKHNARYGVTQSSGKSLDFGMELYDFKALNVEKCLSCDPPIFLPYLNGERAPIWDSNARGVFFGINTHCNKEALAYSVMEGVTFSIYHIYETMGKPHVESLTVSGGASKDAIMNKLKASIFNCPVYVPDETDSSAFGAQIIASIGCGDLEKDDVEGSLSKLCAKNLSALPDTDIGDKLRKRFEIYKSLYPALKEQFSKT